MIAKRWRLIVVVSLVILVLIAALFAAGGELETLSVLMTAGRIR